MPTWYLHVKTWPYVLLWTYGKQILVPVAEYEYNPFGHFKASDTSVQKKEEDFSSWWNGQVQMFVQGLIKLIHFNLTR